MAMDVYAPCPCGSGKKLKFCCQNIAEDMDRISRLIENNQSRQALQQLEILDRRAPGHSWVVTTQAVVLLEIGETLEARNRLKTYCEQHPENEFAAVLFAAASFQEDGLDAARPAIARAFQKGAKKHGAMLSGMAAAMAAVLRTRGLWMAAREHLALSLKFAPEQSRQEIFVRLLDFDNDAEVLYPLRSAHPLPAIPGDEEMQAEVKKATKYASVGCWNTAAAIFEKLTATHPDVPQLRHAAGLCHAWYGDDGQAATALHEAAQRYSEDVSDAVECETLAQILDLSTSAQRVQRAELTGTVSSVGRLLTLLDAHPRLLRIEIPPQEVPEGAPRPAGLYQVLSVEKDQIPAPADLTLANAPTSLAEVLIFDEHSQTGEPASVEVVSLEGPEHAQAMDLVRAAAGDLVTWKGVEPTGEYIPTDLMYAQTRLAYPAKYPVALRRRLERERWQQVIHNEWLNQPLTALGGRSPREAATHPDQRVRILAAVTVLDAVCLRGVYELNTDELLAQLGVQPLAAVELDEGESLNTLSPLEWLRLPLAKLSDAHLKAVVNRAQLLHHDRFLKSALQELLKRPQCLDQFDDTRVYQTLAALASAHDQRDEALKWIAEARDRAAAQPDNFERVWSWDLRELLLRLEEPNDPGLKALTEKFVRYYSPKLPQMRPYLEQMFALAGLPSPWLETGLITPDSASPAGSLWTPGATEPAAAGSKLWLPS